MYNMQISRCKIYLCCTWLIPRRRVRLAATWLIPRCRSYLCWLAGFGEPVTDTLKNTFRIAHGLVRSFRIAAVSVYYTFESSRFQTTTSSSLLTR